MFKDWTTTTNFCIVYYVAMYNATKTCDAIVQQLCPHVPFSQYIPFDYRHSS